MIIFLSLALLILCGNLRNESAHAADLPPAEPIGPISKEEPQAESQAEKAIPTPKKKSPKKNLVSIHYPEMTDIQVIADEVARWTKKNFIWDQKVKGKIKIIAPEKLSPEDAYKTFLSSLDMLGLSTIETGKVVKIMKTTEGMKSSSPIYRPSQELPGSDELVTQVLPLRYIRAKWILASLSRFATPRSMIAIENTNTLIITDSAKKIERILDIISFLDVGSQQPSLKMIAIKHALPSDIAKKLKEFSAIEASSAKSKKSKAKKSFKVLGLDANGLLVLMAPPVMLKRIEQFARSLDLAPKMEAGESRIHLRPIEFADAKKLAVVLNALSLANRQKANAYTNNNSQLKITADEPSNSIIVAGTRSEFHDVDYIIQKLDKRKSQILIEAEVLEIGTDHTFTVGTSIFAGSAGSTDIITAWQAGAMAPLILASSDALSTSQGVRAQQFTSATNEGLNIAALSGKGVEVPGLGTITPGALIRLLKSDSDTRVLSSPYILTVDNTEASLSAGETIFFRNSDTDSLGTTRTNVEKENIEMSLTIHPKISGNNDLSLTLMLDATELSGFSFGLPQVSHKKIKQSIFLRNGQTAVIAGLKNIIESEATSKIPFLGDIPIIGHLFRNNVKVTKTKQLAIFLTPYVIHEASDLQRIYQDKLKETNFFLSKAQKDQTN
ncbi:MAG: type II secretion system secretin GspD [Oligoflexales bacterium]|nr:type II secretion system secretin GspD [Oligoflexales bacterium]